MKPSMKLFSWVRKNGKGEKTSPQKFSMSLRNITTEKDILSLKFTIRELTILVTTLVVFFSAFLICIIAFTPLREFIPGYPNAKSRNDLVRNAFVIDSLTREMKLWQLQMANIQRIAVGQEPYEIDSMLLITGFGDTLDIASKESMAAADSTLRSVVEREDESLAKKEKSEIFKELVDMHLSPPASGHVIRDFTADHPSVEVTVHENSVVFATFDGTMISADFIEGKGYAIQIQHPGNLVSVYRNNVQLLKNPGDAVTAGMPIAIMGSMTGKGGGGNLQFELWYNGVAVNPTDYMKF